MKTDVFISYSSKDKLIADAVCHSLEERRISCWMAPRDVIPGKAYGGQIIHAIKECAVVVLVFSKNANSSEHVGNEVGRAFDAQKTIIPFVVEKSDVNEDLEYYLGRKHWLEAYPDYREKTADLIQSILRLLDRTPIDFIEGPECVAIKMVDVEGGSFIMGATLEQGKDGDDSEKPAHNVHISSFKISEHCCPLKVVDVVNS